jgi:peptidoglycan/LPS O-acetylase OafA/YrhL
MRSYFHTLDGVRLASALAVAFFHLGFYCWANPSSTVGHAFANSGRFDALAPWAWCGWVGVETFFVISGLVIANSANGATPIAFAKSRALRLYPAVWICAPITFLALAFAVGDPLGDLLLPLAKSLALIPNGPWIDGVYWSLAVELVFYCVVFLMLVGGRFSSLPLMAWGLTAWGGLYLTGVVLRDVNIMPGSMLWDVLSAHQDILLLRHGTFFALGIWLWLSSQHLMTVARWICAGACVLFGCIEVADHGYEVRQVGQNYTGFPVGVPIALWLGSVLLMFLATRFPEVFAPDSQRARQWLKRAGAMTYPLYLVHSVAGAGLMRLLISYGTNQWLALAVAFTAAVSVSYLVATVWEPNVRKQLRAAIEHFEQGVLRPATTLAFLFAPGGRMTSPRDPAHLD